MFGLEVLAIILSLTSALPVDDKGGRRPCCCLDSSSSSSSTSYCSFSSSSSECREPVCCNTVLMEYDFNRVKIEPGVGDWNFGTTTNGTVLDDGTYKFVGCAGAEVDSYPYTLWQEPSAVAANDYYKWLLNDQGGLLPTLVLEDQVISVSWKSGVRTFRTDQSPYSGSVVQKDDMRLASGVFLANDGPSGLVFGYSVTNDRIYGIYRRELSAEYGGFTYVIPFVARKPCALNKLRLEFNEGYKYVSYHVDGYEVYKIKNVGERLQNNILLVKDFGAGTIAPALQYPSSLTFAFGTATFLDWYPACKDANCHSCRFPIIRQPLLNLTTADGPRACNVIEGCGFPETYVQADGSNQVFHIWGQGTELNLGEFKVERYACY